MFQKIIIRTTLKIITGLHIGTGGAFSAIGAVDSPVVKDSLSRLPVIPGSSLKGKMRTLLARHISGGTASESPNGDPPKIIRRLFGASSPDIIKSRLQFSDAFISNAEKFSECGITEVKFENTINRGTCVANPRQIERVVKGVEFETVISYDAFNEKEAAEDLKNLATAMKLLQLDYLGGHGTRGSGRVSFTSIKFESFDNPSEKPSLISPEIKELFKAVETYDLLQY